MQSHVLTVEERRRRKELVEKYLREGYAPLRIRIGQSAVEEADRADGKASGTFARWVRDEEARLKRGLDAILPDWSLYTGPLPEFLTPPSLMPPQTPNARWDAPIEPIEIHDPDDVDARARALRRDVLSLVTGSRFPVANTEAIHVETNFTRRFNRKTGEYEDRPAKPKTWISEKLRAAPIEDCAGRRFLFTAAQNDSPLHEGFWTNLQAYARHTGAEIVVGPITYETTWWAENSPVARSYPGELTPHLCFGELAIGDRFVFAGEMNTLITAAQPIGDLLTYPRNRWAVFPHPKRQLKSVVSTDPEVQSHQVMTSGICTKPKITPRKAGIKSLFHQVIGAVIVEFDEAGHIFCRQLTATECGSFYDLDCHVSNGVVTTGHRVRAMVCADVHLRKLQPRNAFAVFGFYNLEFASVTRTNSMLEVLDPEIVLLHDLFDNESRNHHHASDNAYSYEMAVRDRDDVAQEIGQVANFLVSVGKGNRQTIVVESNHDIGLERYAKEGRYRNDGKNVLTGLKLEKAYLEYRERAGLAVDAGQKPPKFSLLEWGIENIAGVLLQGKNISWAYDGGSKLIDGIECGHHGFRGANGSRGTVAGYARMGRRMTIADKHCPEINEGVFVAGAMELNHGYNKGPSGWAVSQVLQYADGHRAIVTLQDGRWRAAKPRISVRG